MKIVSLHISGAFQITYSPFKDDRGMFYRTYCKDEFEKNGLFFDWVQMNHSVTQSKGTIRGMHFQNYPMEETKLVRCTSGAVFDVFIDLRPQSITYRKYFSTILSPLYLNALIIPKGCAHGFQALDEHCEMIYLHDAFYSKPHENGINPFDPAISIEWPLPCTNISIKDNSYPYLPLIQ